MRLPIYGSFSPFDNIPYKGIVRLSPAVARTLNPDGTYDVKVLVELALLGERRLFTERFDQL